MEQDDIRFEKHCRDDLYFFCPLCLDYHTKIFYKSSNSWGKHTLCQAPADVQDCFLKDA